MTVAASGDAGGDARLLGAGSLYAVATVAPVLAALLVTPLVTRLLGGHEYGYVALFLTSNQLGQVAAGLGLPAAISRRVAMNGDQAGRAVGTSLLLSGAVLGPLILGGLSIAVLQVQAPLVVAGFATASSCFLASFTCAQAVSRGLGEVGVFVAQAMALSLGGPVAGLALASTLGGFEHYMAGVLIVQGLCAAQAVARLQRRHGHVIALSSIREDLWLGLPTVPHQFATVGATALLVLASGRSGGPEVAGELQLTILYGTAVLLVLGALNNSWAIQFYALPVRDRGRFLTHTASLLAVVAATGAVMAALLAPLGVGWLADSGMDRAAMAAAASIAATAAPFMVLYLANVHSVFADGRTWVLAVFTPISLAVMGLLVLTVGRRDPSLVLWAGGVPIFYALQAAWATVVRRGSGPRGVRLILPYTVSMLSLAICGVVAVTSPSLGVRVVGAALSAGLGISVAAALIRGERSG